MDLALFAVPVAFLLHTSCLCSLSLFQPIMLLPHNGRTPQKLSVCSHAPHVLDVAALPAAPLDRLHIKVEVRHVTVLLQYSSTTNLGSTTSSSRHMPSFTGGAREVGKHRPDLNRAEECSTVHKHNVLPAFGHLKKVLVRTLKIDGCAGAPEPMSVWWEQPAALTCRQNTVVTPSFSARKSTSAGVCQHACASTPQVKV